MTTLSLVHVVGLAVAGALGAAARFGLASLAQRVRVVPPEARVAFVGTVSVNLSGAFVAGILAGWAGAHPEAVPAWFPMLTVGFLGAFTTYSTWALEGVELRRAGRGWMAYVYLAGTVALGVGLAALGWWLAARR